MIYLRARYMDPSIGRFISEDPVKAGLNWYVYANNNPIMFIDPMGLDALIITKNNAVPVAGTPQGHTSAIYQNKNNEWFYTYWGNKAAAVIRIPDEYIAEFKRNGDVMANSMDSLSNFNTALNRFLSANGYENITSDYTDATYVVGDFTASLSAAYDDVVVMANLNIFSNGTMTTHHDGSKVFQGHNGAYDVLQNNCFDRTYTSLGKGTLKNGASVSSYMTALSFNGGMVPNNAIDKFSQVFMNSSFTLAGAKPSLINYVRLYAEGSPWAQSGIKANYAYSVVRK